MKAVYISVAVILGLVLAVAVLVGFQPLMRYQTCKAIITNRLVAPATAKWQPLLSAEQSTNGSTEFYVVMYVDSQNTYGALLRTHCVCTLTQEKSGSWTGTSKCQ